MKKTILMVLLPFIFACSSCNRLTPENAINAVMTSSQDNLPIIKQSFFMVDDITIDSMHLTIDQEPMAGHLYTTWTTDGHSESVIIPITDIQKSSENKDFIEWQAHWDKVAELYFMKQMYE